jgi:ATP-dependent DNA helicase DinG
LIPSAASFWEGIDLPGDILQILIVTRLPFENPQRLQVKARNDFLAAEGINPFFQEAVPHAALRLRQALGSIPSQKLSAPNSNASLDNKNRFSSFSRLPPIP